jgi:hypothetical protein
MFRISPNRIARSAALAGAALLGALGASSARAEATSAAASAKPLMPIFSPDPETAWVPDRPTGDDYIAPASGAGPVVSVKDHPYVPNGIGEQPTYRIADTSNPILMPWVVAQMDKANEEVRNGAVPYIVRERCWPAGVPAYAVYTRVQPNFILQTDKEVVFVNELNTQFRHIYLNVAHSQNPKPSWYGESVGHYEGGELVVDTIGLNDKTYIDNYRTPHTDKIHVIERFSLIDGGNILQDSLWVEDSGAFTMPWTAVQRWRKVRTLPLFEYLCESSNLDYFTYRVVPSPVAGKPDF